jgi:hypothetical protein
VARGKHQDGPGLPLYLTEPGRAVVEFGLHLATRPLTHRRLPAGDGHPVLVLPGLLADDITTRPLRKVLTRLGYETYGWGLGRNIGPTAKCVTGLRDKIYEVTDRHGRPASVIGWSLGGIFARDLARRVPAEVRQVITLGSPFRLARHSQTRASKMFDRFSHLHVEERTLPLEEDAPPLRMPATSIYSHLDGIVHWQTCLNPVADRCENIAVTASHLGLGHHPAAVWAIADRLAQAEGTWAPFTPPLFLRPAFPKPAEAAAPGPLAAEDTAA